MTAVLVAVLASHLVSDPPPISPGAWRRLVDALPADREFGLESVQTAIDRALTPEERARAHARLELLDRFADVAAELESQGIGLVSSLDPDYPVAWKRRIPKHCPPLLFVAGARLVLQRESIGIVGSREMDSEAAEWTRSVAREAVRLGYAVVSGGARGVDQEASRSALASGGQSLAILADSLARAHQSALREGAYDRGMLCLCSPYVPDAPFSVGNAMGRNKLVYAHSKATLAVCSAEGSGGTWNGAVDALRQELCPVIVWDRADLPGNQRLIRMGGIPLAAAEGLEAALALARPAQGSLF